ncbi:hypothetical protein CTAM01_08548 [Colletotrichum tamarilloi]|uniref:Uncharacterized protein n=1 Tax=Colletotrichum tamarilloi TaxID=1209934 RepID=A0ABQ9R5S3_9PEZI|nr:uncharacterized protein CTAM01_08548 [Colletotrichum tamarilloi]KAK1495419.1 hypothetical protein CTAM01_08548 [Colletotrichum tamarilloi]
MSCQTSTTKSPSIRSQSLGHSRRNKKASPCRREITSVQTKQPKAQAPQKRSLGKKRKQTPSSSLSFFLAFRLSTPICSCLPSTSAPSLPSGPFPSPLLLNFESPRLMSTFLEDVGARGCRAAGHHGPRHRRQQQPSHHLPSNLASKRAGSSLDITVQHCMLT